MRAWVTSTEKGISSVHILTCDILICFLCFLPFLLDTSLNQLGAAEIDLSTQLHHIVWVGDMNYRCVQGADHGHRDKAFPGDRAIGMLEQVCIVKSSQDNSIRATEFGLQRGHGRKSD